MIETKSELARALKATCLKFEDIVAVPILDTAQLAFVIALDPADVEGAWRQARACLGETGRWPVVCELWSAPPAASLFARVTAANLFSRYGFDKSGDEKAREPLAIIERSKTVDVDAFLAGMEEQSTADVDLADEWTRALTATQSIYGSAPSEVEQAGFHAENPQAIDRELMAWEMSLAERCTPDWMRAQWYEPGDPVLVFLPTAIGFDALAYLGWWGSTYHDAACDVALARRWELKFGAELVAHYGTMLQFLVERPPSSLEAAWTLGREHTLVAPCNLLLPGIGLRHYARGLVNSDRWMLHERP